MPGFCVNCGAPLAGVFCNKCGSRAVAPSPAVQAQPAVQSVISAPAPPAVQHVAVPAKSSGAGKVLMIVGGVLLLLFVMGIAGALYGAYWVKHKISAYTDGVVGGSQEQVKVEHGNTCALLKREDLQQMLGVTIERTSEVMEGEEPGCAYYTNPDAFAQLQRMAVQQARRDSEKAAKQPGPKTDNPLELLKDANQLEGVVKSFGLTQPDQDGRVFSFSVQPNFGRGNWTALRTTMAVVPGFEEVTGVGDRAMMGSFGHAFYVLKGDGIIHLELTYVPDARARGAEIGRKIASGL